MQRSNEPACAAEGIGCGRSDSQLERHESSVFRVSDEHAHPGIDSDSPGRRELRLAGAGLRESAEHLSIWRQLREPAGAVLNHVESAIRRKREVVGQVE